MRIKWLLGILFLLAGAGLTPLSAGNLVQLLADPGFEAGPNGWWVASPAFYIDGAPVFPNPHSGVNYAFLTNPDGTKGNNLTGGMISPQVTIPSTATDLDLRFWYSISSDETTTTQAFDKLEVYLVRPGNQLTLLSTLSNLDETGTSYALHSRDISSSFYGETVQVFFRGTTNASLPTVFRVDDVTLDVEVPSGGPPIVSTLPADLVTGTSARLSASVNPNGATTEVWFDLEANDPTPSTDTEHFSIGGGNQTQTVTWTAGGLFCGTTYFFRANAGNAHDASVNGQVRSFTTAACSTDLQPVLFASRQSCAGAVPAVLLGWTMPEDADPLVTIRRSDGQFVATVNTAITGPTYAVTSGLQFGNSYTFTVEVDVDGDTYTSNALTFHVSSDECRVPVIPGDPPHRPIFWAEKPFCQAGVAKVRLWWTETPGAGMYSVKRIGAFMPSATYDGLTGTAFVDSDLTPGAGALYELTAHSASGFAISWLQGVLVPGTVCTTTGAPGPFSSSMSEPVCEDDEGAATVQWGPSSGAADDYRRFDFADHLLWSLSDNEDEFSADIDHLDLGSVARVVIQAESASVPGRFREAHPVARLVPLDVCGGGSAAIPTVGATSATYVREEEVLLRASVTGNGSHASARFEWGTTTAYGLQTPLRSIGSQYSPATLGEVLSDLACGTTYHFRAIASNGIGVTEGAGSSFTTAPCSGPVSVSVTATDPTATEAPVTSGEFLIERTGSTGDALTVFFSVGGSATAGVDHTLATGSVTILAGASSVPVPVLPLDDPFEEPDETVVLTLEPGGGYVVGAPGSATVVIASEDVCMVTAGTPAGGEVWVKGEPHLVEWTANPACLDFALILRRNGLFDGFIGSSIEGQVYSWTPSAWIVPGGGLQIEVVGFPEDGLGVSDLSGSFSLVNPATLPAVIFADAVEGGEFIGYDFGGWGVTDSTAHSPTHSYADSPGNYENSANRSLITPPLDVSGRTSLALRFWHRFEFADFDSGNVWVRGDGGDWVLLQGFGGTQLDWEEVTLDLSAFVGHASVQIAFQVFTDESVTADGWYVDDILLSAGSFIFSDGFESGDLSHWSGSTLPSAGP